MPIKPGTAAALRDLFAENRSIKPDTDRTMLQEIFGEWGERYDAERGEHVRSSTAPIYASDLTACARRVAYTVLDRLFPEDSPGPTNPITLSDKWRFYLGQTVHDAVQAVAVDQGWGEEVRAILMHDGDEFVSSRGDLYREADGTVVEIKSATGFPFKMATTTFKGGPEGPKFGHLTQLALTAKALHESGHEVNQGVVLLAALENLGKTWVAKDPDADEFTPFAAPFTIPAEELFELADEQIAWLARILAKLEEGELPPRTLNDPDYPLYAVVHDPAKGKWEARDGSSKGETWVCSYCPWQSMCADAADRGE